MKKLYLLTLATLFTCAAFAATVERTGDEEANWSDLSIWSPSVPTSSDNVRLWNGATTYATNDVTIINLGIQSDSVLNVTAGLFTVNGAVYHNQGTVNIYESGALKTTQYIMGDSDNSLAGGVLNVYGNASFTMGSNDGMRIGTTAVNNDVEANFYGDAKINGRLRIGSEAADSGASSVVNIYDRAVVKTDYINLYQNATLNISGNANVTASSDLRFHDMTASTVGTVDISGSSSLSARGGFIGDGATVTVSGSANFIQNGGSGNNIYLGADYNKASSGNGHIVLKDNATFKTSQNLIMLNNSTFTVEGSNVTVNLQALGGGISTMDAKIIFKADADGISKITSRFAADVDASKQTSFALELDFTNLNLAEGTYEFDIVSLTENADREKTIIQNYELFAKDLITVKTKNESDGYEFFRKDANDLTLAIRYTVVPEPATYAAIFGALALTFAAYRRRK